MLPAGSLVEAKILAEELRSRADGQEFSRAFKCFGLKEISLETERKHQIWHRCSLGYLKQIHKGCQMIQKSGGGGAGGKTSISFAAPFVSLKLTFQLTFY